MITNAGLAALAARQLWDTADHEAPFTYIAVGTDDTAAAATQTTLEAEITDSGLERAAGTPTQEDTNVTDDTAQLVKAFSVTGTKAIKEVGVFNAASAGTMLSRDVITTKNVENGDTITITHKVVKTNV